MSKLIAIVIVAISFTSCGTETVGGNEEGVFIKKPYIWGSDGVDTTDILTDGRFKLCVDVHHIYLNILERIGT